MSRRITAVLGPTNTGKTYLAIERMLGHASGMMGFPLRLLARENYDRVVALKGRSRVALVTGEEKIIPPQARYFLCTVESMPLDRPVAFLGIDEVQLAADPDRGHVFTDRLLRARGTEETMFLGADTIRPLIRRLVPEAEFISRPRFSVLSYSGTKKLTRLPRRSAVIAFSAADVYELAELMRRHRGGAAVVLGALSPRARNAQVAMFQSGDVDHIIATDAIGMGLNMDIDHVAFARLTKFDGRRPRRLKAAEIAQIAGRAGRHMSDGTFGTTTDIGPLDAETVSAVEEHRFERLSGVYWRNPDLRFESLHALLKSLDKPPVAAELIRAREADDHMALAALARDAAVLKRALDPDAVRLLWEVCQVPDFRKILTDAHTSLLKRIFLHLTDQELCLPEDWVASNIARLDRVDGDIDTLASRIAHVRTWTYIAYRGDWLADPVHWQETTRAIEDRLSDALHQALTLRFVDRRAATLMSRLKDRGDLRALVKHGGEVAVEGMVIGRLDGFRFTADALAHGDDAKPLIAAAHRALRGEVAARLAAFEAAPPEELSIGANGAIFWRGAAVARLRPGKLPLSPHVEPVATDLLEGVERERVRRRAASWLADHVGQSLAPLLRLRDADLTGTARGIAYQICEQLGSIARAACETEIASLKPSDRQALAKFGVRIGREAVYLPALLRPAALSMRGVLWSVYRGKPAPLPEKLELVSFAGQEEVPDAAYYAIGFRAFRGSGTARAIRVDIVERLLDAAYRKANEGAFGATSDLCGLAGCGPKELAVALGAMGFVAKMDEDGVTFHRRLQQRAQDARKPSAKTRRGRRRKRYDEGGASPFAKLRDLDFKR